MFGRICGIVFYMFREKGQPHHSEHVLAVYGEHRANYHIERRFRLNGYMPNRQERVILNILSRHKAEFLDCWKSLNQEDPITPSPIQFSRKRCG